jgi:hypothetical protein
MQLNRDFLYVEKWKSATLIAKCIHLIVERAT